MNIYEHEFTAGCSVDGKRIYYSLTLTTERTIMVEDIIEACDGLDGIQEELARDIKLKFGCDTKLEGTHSGVRVTTTL